MNIYLKSFLAAIIVTALCLFFLSAKKTVPVYNATLLLVPDKSKTGTDKFKDRDLKELIRKISKRSELYAAESNVTLDEQRKIRVELFNVDKKEGLEKNFTGSSILEIWEVYDARIFSGALNKADQIYREDNLSLTDTRKIEPDTITNYDTNLLSNVDAKTRKENKRKSEGFFSLLNLSESQGLEAGLGHIKTKDTSTMTRYLTNPEVTKLLPSDLVFVFGKDPTTGLDNDSTYALFAIKTYNDPDRPFLTDKDIKSARQDYDRTDQKPNISLEFSDKGAEVWEKLTERNVNKPIAILIDKNVLSAPIVTEKISGGNTIINGSYTIEKAMITASQLNSGRLPVPLAVESLQINKVNTAYKKNILILGICFAFCFGMAFLIFYQLKPPVPK